MKHLFSLEESNFPLSDEEFLYRFLAIEIGSNITQILRIIVIEEGEEISLDDGYVLKCYPNQHLPEGSVAYKLIYTKTKLNIEKAQELGIPFDSTLKKIEKNKEPVIINGKTISRSDVFQDITISVGYSGDTAIDEKLLSSLSDCGILIHESTYFSTNNNYHLDIHSDLKSLIEKIKHNKKLFLLLPLHFSSRYTSEEIKGFLAEISDVNFVIINPIEILAFQVDQNSLKARFRRPLL
jgi:ribonuclease BN (tRNA processing enzyme)